MVLTKVRVPPGPLGAEIKPDLYGRAAVISAFVPMPTGSAGPIQKKRAIRVGDVIVKVNQESVLEKSFAQVHQLLRSLEPRTRELTVCDAQTSAWRTVLYDPAGGAVSQRCSLDMGRSLVC